MPLPRARLLTLLLAAADALRVALRDNKAQAADLGLVVREYNDLVRDFAAINFGAAAPTPPTTPTPARP